MADSPAYVLPLVFTKAYQTKQYGSTGSIYSVGADTSVFGYLHDPPSTGVAAEDAGNEAAETVGTVLSPNPALLDRKRQRDGMRDFYDSASILRT